MDAAQTPYNIGTEAEEARHVCSGPQVPPRSLSPSLCTGSMELPRTFLTSWKNAVFANVLDMLLFLLVTVRQSAIPKSKNKSDTFLHPRVP